MVILRGGAKVGAKLTGVHGAGAAIQFANFQPKIPKSKMADKSPVTVRTRKFLRNPLLSRRQMVRV